CAAKALEIITAAGMVTAPTITAAATGIMIGTTATVIGLFLLQGAYQGVSCFRSCVVGDWGKVTKDLDRFHDFITSKETIATVAQFAGGASVATPILNYVTGQILSLRPVIVQVENQAKQSVAKLYLMHKDKIALVYEQSLELLQSPAFKHFQMLYEKILEINFFKILPKNHPALLPAFADVESNSIHGISQNMFTHLFAEQEGFVVSKVIQDETAKIVTATVTNQLQKPVAQLVENVTKDLAQTVVSSSIEKLQKIVADEIANALHNVDTTMYTNLFAPITQERAVELATLSKSIRQLQDLAKYTNNFQNLDKLLPYDIAYLNRIYELQAYRAQIKNFLDTYKPYFVFQGQQYGIEDIASYHIHAADSLIKQPPKGGHSNYGGRALVYFDLEVTTHGPLGAQDVILRNFRNSNLKKPSSLYPQDWPEFVCDLKAIEVMMNKDVIIKNSDDLKTIELIGFTNEKLKIRVIYDVINKRIKTHHPLIKEL
ncbi:MAG: hypothetical protein ACXWL5_05180, partial [Candidatus Chromulinivorax sp.]